MSEEKGLETLQIWQRAMAFSLNVQREILPLFPLEEKWAMAAQLRRAVQSIPGNIAEGYGRYYYQESVRFCYIARGSLEETFTYLSLANKLGYVPENIFQTLNSEIVEMRRMINGYVSYLTKSKRGESEPGSMLLVKEDSIEYFNDLTPDDPLTRQGSDA
jgi:four helix bundle protein